jgi:hypothetical protein
VKVILPPPEVVFRQAKPCVRPPAETCVVTAAPAPCPPGGGTVTFNMSLNMNALGSGTFGAGLSGSMLGSGLGLGGASSGQLSPEILMLLVRALAGRSGGAVADGGGGNTPVTADELQARIRRLQESITAEMNREVVQVRQELKQTLEGLVKTAKDMEQLRSDLAKATKELEDQRNRAQGGAKPNP